MPAEIEDRNMTVLEIKGYWNGYGEERTHLVRADAISAIIPQSDAFVAPTGEVTKTTEVRFDRGASICTTESYEDLKERVMNALDPGRQIRIQRAKFEKTKANMLSEMKATP
jgi:hypothetical protein